MTKTKTFFIKVYSLITKKGYCEHVSRKDPYTCYRSDVSSQGGCENHCTFQTSCIGYYYYIKSNPTCYLIPSERSCPSGFTPLNESGPIAASMNDLKAYNNPNFVCYGKKQVNKTNNKLIL